MDIFIRCVSITGIVISMGFVFMKVLSSFSWAEKYRMMDLFRSNRFSIPSLLSLSALFLMIVTIIPIQGRANVRILKMEQLKEVVGLVVSVSIFIIALLLYIKKHIKGGIFFALLIFSIFAGLAIANYDAVKLQWKGVELQTMKKDIASLKIQVGQTLNLKQDISTTVNNITKVEKEIADIKMIFPRKSGHNEELVVA